MQTYERSYIKKWLDVGCRTCLKMQQTLSHSALTPNYVLKSLISLWCERNAIELPKEQGNCRTKKYRLRLSNIVQIVIDALLNKLKHGNIEWQRPALAAS